MKYMLLWGGILLSALVLQSTLLPALAYHGIVADLLLLIVVLGSLHFGRKQGTMIGFCAGLLQDLCSGTFFGINIFAKLLIAYCFSLAERQVFKDNVCLSMVATALATVANYFIGVFIMILLGYRFNLLNNMVTMLVPLLIYNVILTVPVHSFICKISAKSKEA